MNKTEHNQLLSALKIVKRYTREQQTLNKAKFRSYHEIYTHMKVEDLCSSDSQTIMHKMEQSAHLIDELIHLDLLVSKNIKTLEGSLVE